MNPLGQTQPDRNAFCQFISLKQNEIKIGKKKYEGMYTILNCDFERKSIKRNHQMSIQTDENFDIFGKI